MTAKQLDQLIELSSTPWTHGKWSRFALANGLTKDMVYHWRKKLGLQVRRYTVPQRPSP